MPLLDPDYSIERFSHFLLYLFILAIGRKYAGIRLVNRISDHFNRNLD